ncbi:hypothetical protein KEM56_004115, partial [Ascosphaera pollenicola]
MSSYRSRSFSASEGEIIESGPHTEAIQLRSFVGDNNVDRNTRQSPSNRRPPSLTRGHCRERSSSRSSPNQSRHGKRKYDSDLDSDRKRPTPYGRSRYSRQEARYNGRPERGHDRDNGRRNKVSYRDYDNYGHDERNRRTDRSRSPFRDPRRPKRYSDDEDERGATRSALHDTARDIVRNEIGRSALQRPVGEQQRPANAVLSHQGSAYETSGGQSKCVTFAEGTNASKEHPSGQVEQKLVDYAGKSNVSQFSETVDSTEPLDEAAQIEQRRKKREAILA